MFDHKNKKIKDLIEYIKKLNDSKNLKIIEININPLLNINDNMPDSYCFPVYVKQRGGRNELTIFIDCYIKNSEPINLLLIKVEDYSHLTAAYISESI